MFKAAIGSFTNLDLRKAIKKYVRPEQRDEKFQLISSEEKDNLAKEMMEYKNRDSLHGNALDIAIQRDDLYILCKVIELGATPSFRTNGYLDGAKNPVIFEIVTELFKEKLAEEEKKPSACKFNY